MHQQHHLAIGQAAALDAGEVADSHIDRHLHAGHRTTQHHALAMQFDLPNPAISAIIMRVEADR